MLFRSGKNDVDDFWRKLCDGDDACHSILAISYGEMTLEDQVLPRTGEELNHCRLLYERLPDHRKTKMVREAMLRAIDHILPQE